MDIPLGLMMTAVALYQEAETPLGEVAFFRPDGPAKADSKEPQPTDPGREDMVASIRQSFEEFEHSERVHLPEEREGIYRAMRQMAQWFAQGRFEEDEEEDNA